MEADTRGLKLTCCCRSVIALIGPRDTPFLEFGGFLQEFQARVRQQDAVQHLLEVSLCHTVCIILPQDIKQADDRLSLQKHCPVSAPML